MHTRLTRCATLDATHCCCQVVTMSAPTAAAWRDSRPTYLAWPSWCTWREERGQEGGQVVHLGRGGTKGSRWCTGGRTKREQVVRRREPPDPAMHSCAKPGCWHAHACRPLAPLPIQPTSPAWHWPLSSAALAAVANSVPHTQNGLTQVCHMAPTERAPLSFVTLGASLAARAAATLGVLCARTVSCSSSRSSPPAPRAAPPALARVRLVLRGRREAGRSGLC